MHGPLNSIGKVQMRDGSSLLLDAKSRTEGGPFWTGQYTYAEIELLKICASMGQVGFDVGANVGLITIPLARYVESLGKGGKVIAFEPIKANFDRLIQNIQLNNLESIVSAHNVALGDKDEDIEMALETRYGATTGNACVGAQVRNPSKYTTCPAHMTRLDTFAAAHDVERVDFIKIDVEGAEVMFLRGGVEFLARHRPIIYGEFCANMKPRFGDSFLDAARIIGPWNYAIFRFNRLEPVEIVEPRIGLENILLIPAEKTDEFLHRLEMVRQVN